MSLALTDYFKKEFSFFLTKKNTEVTEFKKKNFEIFLKQGFPNNSLEEWKYSSIINNFEAVSDIFNSCNKEKISNIHFENFEHNKIIVYNGRFLTADFFKDDKDKIIVKSIEEYFNDQKFGYLKTNYITKNSLVNLNNAFSRDGFYFLVKENSNFQYPIIIYSIFDKIISKKICFQKNIVELEKNSNIIIYQKNIFNNNSSFLNLSTTYKIENNSRLKNYILNKNSLDNNVFRYQEFFLSKNSFLENLTFSHSVKNTRDELELHLNDSFADGNLYNIQSLIDSDDHEIKIKIFHNSENTKSNQTARCVLDGKSRGVYQGKIFVDSKAQKTDGYQLIKSLLLSDKANFHSKPELEIYADDVRCSHGSSSSSLNPDEIFYLMTRGLTKLDAKKLLVKAYITEVLEKIYDKNIRNIFIELAEKIYE